MSACGGDAASPPTPPAGLAHELREPDGSQTGSSPPLPAEADPGPPVRVAPGDQPVAAPSADVSAALLRAERLARSYAPVLLFHPAEVFRPQTVTLLLDHAVLQRVTDDAITVLAAQLTPEALARLGRADTALDVQAPDLELTVRSPDPEILEGAPDPYHAWYRRIAAAYPPTVYARVVEQAGDTVIQYWFFYPLNDAFNRHEGDWEVIVLVFPGITPIEVLTQPSTAPAVVAYSQHGAGTRRADWAALAPEGRPLV